MMDIEKLIESVRLCGSTPKVDQCKQCAYWSGGDMSKCIPRMTTDAATALSTIQAENAEMQQQLNEFSEFLCHMTGGLLSKTNYTAQEMIAAADDYQQKVCGECDLRVENEKLLAENIRWGQVASEQDKHLDKLRAELEQVKRERDAAVEEVERMKTIMRDNGIMTIPSKYPGGPSEWNIPKPRGQKED